VNFYYILIGTTITNGLINFIKDCSGLCRGKRKWR